MVFNDLVLSGIQVKTLRQIAKGKSSKLNQDALRFLMRHDLVATVNVIGVAYGNQHPSYALTEQGKMQLVYTAIDQRRTWYPYIVSTLAFIVALAAFIRTLVC